MGTEDVQKLSVHIRWDPAWGCNDIIFTNLSSVLGEERAMQFMTIMARSLWSCQIDVTFRDRFRVSIVSKSHGPFIVSTYDLLRIAREEIRRVACVAGVECNFA